MTDLIAQIRRDRAACGDTSTLATTAQITAYASRSKRLSELEDAYIEQAGEIERLKTGLARIALPCAFYVATSVVNPEAFARMIYAEKVWSGIEPSEADDQTEIETRNRYPLQGDKT